MHRIDPSPLTIRFDSIYRRPALCCPPAVVANAPMTATTACQINNRRPRRVFARSSSSAARFVGVPIGETIRSKSNVCLYVPVSKCDDSQVEFFLIAVEMCRFASRFSFFCFVFCGNRKCITLFGHIQVILFLMSVGAHSDASERTLLGNVRLID